MTDQTTKWHPIDTAPHDWFVVVRGPGLDEQGSFYGRPSHVPIYGWLDMCVDDPNDVELLRPRPTEWRVMTMEESGNGEI